MNNPTSSTATERLSVIPEDFSALKASADVVARRLLGCILERYIDGHIIRVRIIETEAYDQTDAASHSYRGQTERTRSMFGLAGHLYVYFTYGMHYCCNIVTGPVGMGSAVLIRAVEPIEGEPIMASRRSRSGVEISNGPAKVCQALGIDMALYDHDLHQEPLKLLMAPPLDSSGITQTVRVGIRHGVDVPWRFYVSDSPYVSRR